MRKIFILAAMAFVSACNGTIPVQYQAQTFLRAAGATDIGSFSYLPAEEGRVRPNQIQNTAIGSVFIGQNVADLVQRATALELEKAGIILGPQASLRLEGQINEFKADDLGFNVEWTFSITYRIINREGSLVFEKEYDVPEVKTGKFGAPSDYTASVNSMILAGIELFLRDEQAMTVLSSG